MTRRIGFALLSAVVVTLGVACLLAAHRHPDESLAATPAALILQLIAGLGLWAAGLHRRSAWLAAAGIAVFLGELPLPESGSALLFTAALAGGAALPVLCGAAAARRAFFLAAGALGLDLLAAVTFDPAASGCFACPDNLLFVYGTAHDGLVRASLYGTAIAGVALAALALRARAALTAVWLGGAAVAAVGAVASLHAALGGVRVVDPTARALWLAQCALAVALAAGVGWQALRDRRLGRRISAMVIDALPSAQHLRATLAASVGDESLALVFPDSDGGWIDPDGRPASAPEPAAGTTNVMRGDVVIAQLRLASTAALERTVAAAKGAGLALEHASLRAKLRAELAELAASRARIVHTGDHERRRLERNLHDGAQQRLIALTFALEDERAIAELRAALEDLRALAHGIHPVALTEAGLEAAVRELADGSPVPISVLCLPAGRFSEPVEAAAYRLLVDAIAGAPDTVTIALERREDRLETTLSVPGADRDALRGQLQAAADRIAAVAGDLAINAIDDRVLVEASLPCGS